MPFRRTYSNVDSSEQSQALSSLEAVVIIGGQRMGRIQGLRHSGQAQPRPVNEIGSDKSVEFVPGIKQYSGTIQSITIAYGDLVRRIASLTGGQIDPDSYAATLSNLPEFDIQCFQRGTPQYNNPELYAAPSQPQNLVGSGQLIKTFMGCVIESFEGSLNVNESLVMESVSFRFIDIVLNSAPKAPKTLSRDFPV